MCTLFIFIYFPFGNYSEYYLNSFALEIPTYTFHCYNPPIPLENILHIVLKLNNYK